MRWKAKPLICFWLSCVVFLSSAWKNVGINAEKVKENGDFNRTTENMRTFSGLGATQINDRPNQGVLSAIWFQLVLEAVEEC